MDGHRRDDTQSVSRFSARSKGVAPGGKERSVKFGDDRLRARIYGMLGRIFSDEITPEFIEELKNSPLFAVFVEEESGITAGGGAVTSDLESLRVEFARLFIGPGPIAPPYATVYREDDPFVGRTWGRLTGEVKRFMSFYGLECSRESTIPDHLSVLFEFMGRVIEAGVSAAVRGNCGMYEESRRIQKRFFLDYIEPWVGMFFQRVLESDPLPFYIVATEYAVNYVVREKFLLRDRN